MFSNHRWGLKIIGIILNNASTISQTRLQIGTHGCVSRSELSSKIAVLTFKVLHGSAPEYLDRSCHSFRLVDKLRSDSNRLVVPPFKLSTFGRRAFSVAGPQIWNSLPNDITSLQSLPAFRRKLKTHLFSRSFPNLDIQSPFCIGFLFPYLVLVVIVDLAVTLTSYLGHSKTY